MESGSRYRDGAGQIIKINFVKYVSGVIVADVALLIRVPTLPITPVPQRLPNAQVMRLPTCFAIVLG